MAITTTKISELANLGIIDGSEVLPVVKDNVTKSVSIDEISDFITVADVNWGTIGGTLSNQTDLQAVLDDKVDNGGNVATIQRLTQAEYDALTPDPNTVYVIVG